MDITIGTRVIATDEWGNFRNEKGVVVKFDTNMLGQELVMVRLDNYKQRLNCFYRSELRVVE